MKKTKTQSVPHYALAMPAGEDIPPELNRFFDAVFTAIQNTVKREDAAFRKFRPIARIGATTYGGSILKAPKASLSSTSYGSSIAGTAEERTKETDTG